MNVEFLTDEAALPTIGDMISWDTSLFLTLYWFPEGKMKLFLPHPLNVVPLFELPIENNKHPNFEWRGGGRGVDFLFSVVVLFEYSVSTILAPIVDLRSAWLDEVNV